MPYTLSDIETRLQRAGIAPTAQRLAICRYVFNEADHPTAEDVKAWMDGNFPKVSLATVYNTLNVLVEKGLLQELRLPHLERAVYDCNVSRHSHFIDMDTGEMTDLDESKLELRPHLDDSYEIVRAQAVLIGHRRKGT